MRKSRNKLVVLIGRVITPIAAALLIGCGGDDPPTDKVTTDDTSPTDNGDDSASSVEIADRMIKRYQDASSYANEGDVTITTEDGSNHTSKISIRLTRPNRLSLSLAGIQIRCDGKTYSARILDELGNNLNGQVLHRLSPDELNAETVLPDSTLEHRIVNRFPAARRLYLTPLFLLLDRVDYPNRLKSFAQNSELTEAKIGDKPCYCLTNESIVMWVDQADNVVRRIELSGDQPQVVINFENARINDDLPDEAFEPLEIENNVTPVGYFVQPPRQIPVEVLGKRPAEFSFLDLDGNEITQESMDGRLNVLLWCVNDERSQFAMRAISELRRGYSEDEVRFYSVWVDAELVEPNAIRRQLKDWNVDVFAVTDPNQDGNNVFHINDAPSLLVLGEKGVAQYGENGLNPELATTLPPIIDRVKSKVNVAGEQLNEYRSLVALFERSLAEAQAASASQVIEIPKTEIEERTDPKQLVLTKLWTCDELTAPGNILTVNDAKRPMIFVHDGFRTVVQLDADGNVVKRHELDLPSARAVTYLRTATGKDGNRYYVASQHFDRQMHVFDQEWKRLTSYPEVVNQQDAEISDVQLLVLDKEQDELPQMVFGIRDRPILIQVSLDGKKSRIRRLFQPLAAFAPTSRGDVIAVTNNGELLLLDEQVKDPIPTKGPRIHSIYSAQFPPTMYANLCGLVYQDDASMFAVGLTEKYEEQTEGERKTPKLASLDVQWSYKMSAQPFENQIEFVTSGRLLSESGGQWLFALPDSSIHIISDDGKFVDSFHYGKPLAGFAVANLGDRNVLLVASDKEVTAWSVAPKPVEER